jgi:hypothetical protein
MTAASISFDRPRWQTVIIFALAFWLSSSLFLDLILMPTLYASGMGLDPGFATASYSIFWLFNRLELLCAALVLTGALVLHQTRALHRPGAVWAIGLPLFLLAIAILYTYAFTPAMSSLGLELDLFNPATQVPAAMNQMHEGYWSLEVLKLFGAGALLNFYYRTQR